MVNQEDRLTKCWEDEGSHNADQTMGGFLHWAPKKLTVSDAAAIKEDKAAFGLILEIEVLE